MAHSRKPIILASQSPRRIELLKEAVADYIVMPSDIEEIFQQDLSPEDNALNLARDKATWVARKQPGHWVIGADTVVVLGEDILGKPAGPEEARRMLKRLSGRTHRVITAVALVNETAWADTAESQVRIKPLTDEQIDAYIATEEPLDKAGAYAIQGRGSFLVESYEGSYTNIVGLPLETLRALMNQAGLGIS